MKTRYSISHILLIGIIASAILPFGLWAQLSFQNPIKWKEVNGLPSEYVTCVAKDNYGFMWVGTIDGLVRMDGLRSEVFKHVEGDSTTILSNRIYFLYVDREEEELWISTQAGLSVFDLKKKVFRNYYPDPNSKRSVPQAYPYAFYKEKNGQFWLGYRTGGLLKYRRETDDFEQVWCVENTSRCTYSARNIAPDLHNDSIFWIGSDFGIYRFNKITYDYTQFIYENDDPEIKHYSNSARRMYLHDDGILYVGGWYRALRFLILRLTNTPNLMMS